MVVKTKNFWSLLCFDNKTDTPLGDDHVSPVWTFIDFPLYQDGMFDCILGHCHGNFFGFALDSGAVVLANLSLREFRELPQSSNQP